MKKKTYFLLSAVLLALSHSHIVQAAQTGDAVIFNFTGSFILSTPCTVNNDDVLNIPFGNVGIKRINGVDYMQTIPYVVDCHGAPDDTPINLTVSGNTTTFDLAAVVTSAGGLGIEIQANGQPLQLNKALQTTLGELASLQLTAVPVKDPAIELTGQPFTATATLTADYE